MRSDLIERLLCGNDDQEGCKKVALAGGPGVGKSAVFKVFEDVLGDVSDVFLVPEVARELIRQGLDPRVDKGFQDEVMVRGIEAYKKSEDYSLFIIDRPIADGLLYNHPDAPDRFKEAANEYQYDLIFYFPFWPEIYDETDEERAESLAEAEELSIIAKKLFVEEEISGHCVEVPKEMNPVERAEFCLQQILRVCYGFEL